MLRSTFLTATILFSIVIIGNAQSGGSKPFRLSGELRPAANAEWVYLTYVLDGERKMDSVAPKNGAYQFTGVVAEPLMGRLRVAYRVDSAEKRMPSVPARDQAVVFLEPGSVIKVTSIDSFSNITVKGSQAHDSYLQLEKMLKPVNDELKKTSSEYSALYRAKDTVAMKKLEPKFESLDSSLKVIYTDYVKKNPRSPIAVYAISQVAGWDIDPEKVEPLMQLLPATARTLPSAKSLTEKIETAKKTGIGRTAMDFTQNDTLGNPVSLSSFRGKYVLIDFWASWCGPCRVENPNVVQAFQKFRDKGFTVLGVSLDRPNAKDKWIQAIHADNLTWTHVSDLQFWKNAVAVQYGIQAIPQNLLIDKDGKIIAKNLRGEALHQKLAEVLQ